MLVRRLWPAAKFPGADPDELYVSELLEDKDMLLMSDRHISAENTAAPPENWWERGMNRDWIIRMIS